ncbi:MAG: PaaI family thioesterase [Alphaproteobacteria bacterium]|nr:PaaI family thioesterase [Alphaproteobacteria bacterium]
MGEGQISHFDARDPDYAARVKKSFNAQGIMGHIGAHLVSVRPGYCEIELPYSEAVSQQHGFFHGGIIGTIADSAGGYAAFSLMDTENGVLTVEYKLNLMAPADGERLLARGQVLRPGRTLTVTRAEVSVFKDGKETVCAAMQQTLMRIAGPIAGGAEISG